MTENLSYINQSVEAIRIVYYSGDWGSPEGGPLLVGSLRDALLEKQLYGGLVEGF